MECLQCEECAFFFPAIVGVLCLCAALLCLHIHSYGPADNLTYKAVWVKYKSILVAKTHGMFSYYFTVVPELKNPVTTQEQTLLTILKSNADTMYGRKHGFSYITNREEFIAKHPVTTYEHYKDYVDRTVRREENILTKLPAVYLSMTSGTNGKVKAFPMTMANTKMVKYMPALMYQYTSIMHLKREAKFNLYPKERKSESGLRMGGASYFYAPTPPKDGVVPECYAKLYNEKPSFYVQAFFLLKERELGTVEAFSSHLTYAFFKFIEQHWEQLCNDINRGQISDNMDIDESVLEDLNQQIQPHPTRATELRREFEKGIVGLAKRVWPDMFFIFMTKTGSFKHCAKIMEETYFKGIPFTWLGHGASEGFLGMKWNTDPDVNTYVPSLGLIFFEFIPVEDMDKDEPRTLFIDQVEHLI